MSVLRLLSDKTNVAILQLLKIEPSYPRRLAVMLGKREQKVVPRLKKLEAAGLVRAHWDRKVGKNIKVYETNFERIVLELGVKGLDIEYHSAASRQTLSPPLYQPPKLGKDPFFVGRKKELEFISSGSNFAVLEGIPGVGKTSLLQAFVEQLPKNSPVFWHTFRETDSFNYLVAKFATFLEQRNFVDLLDYIRGDSKDDSVKMDLLTRGLDRDRNIVIFDDCHTLHDEKIDSMLSYFQQNLSKARVIVASRTRPDFLANVSSVTEVKLDGLSRSETLLFMKNGNVKLKGDQLDLFHQRTSGHPLALTLLRTILEKDPGRSADSLKEMPIGGLIDELLQSLPEEERNLLLILSVFRNPIPYEGIAVVVKLKGLRYLLHSLEKRIILNQSKGSFLLHELIREGSYKFVDFPEQLHKKIGEWYLAKGSTQEALEGLYHISRAEDWVRVGEVLEQELLERTFHFVEEGLSKSLLRIMEGVKTDVLPPRLACPLLCIKAGALAETREWGRANAALNQAKIIAERLNSPKILGCVYRTMGKNYASRGNLRKAQTNFRLSMSFFKRDGDRDAIRRLELEMAKISFVQGNILEAMKYFSPVEISDALTR